MAVSAQDVVFAFDFSRIESVGGVRYLWDYGPNGFHFAFPGGAADPTPQLDGSLLFDGGDYLSLPAGRFAAFYAALPTGAYTFFCLGRRELAGGATCVPFSCDNNNAGGVWRGILIQSIADGRVRLWHGQGGAALPAMDVAAPAMLPGRKRTVSITNEATARALVDQQTAATSWAVGAFGVIAYDAAVVPTIGVRPGLLGNWWTGPIYYEALIRGALSSQDLSLYSRLLAEGSQKPWCVR